MPDIDIDFCIEGRDTVINYVREKYGHDKVCQIITFGTMMAKGRHQRRCSRTWVSHLKIPMHSPILFPINLKLRLKKRLNKNQSLQELLDANPQVAKLFDLASALEGVTRHASKHAAGIVISPEPISDMLPVYVPSKSTDLVTQYAMTELESLGFLKDGLFGA